MKNWNEILIPVSAGAAILFWFLFKLLGLPTISKALISTVIDTLAIISAVYITNYQLLPKLLYTGKYKTFSFYFFLLVFVFGTSLLFANLKFQWNFLQMGDRKSYWLWSSLFFSSYLLVFFSCGTGAAIQFAIDRLKSEKELSQLKREKVEVELAFLRAQVNPHFLFNSLNSIYYQIDKTNLSARETLTHFSELLRYQLYSIEKQEIELSEELTFLQNYINMQKIRLNPNYKIEYREQGEMNGFYIAPMILMPLAENCFKYMSHYINKMNTISFSINRSNGSFLFSTTNTYEEKANLQETAESGIGLSNVKKRLALLYPGRHNLTINKQKDSFEVRLKIEGK